MTSTTLPEQSNPTPKPAPLPRTPVNVVTRFAVLERIEHIILLLSFSLLALTGLPQKFAAAPVSQAIIDLFGGIESIRVVHHYAAIIMMILSIYHLLAVLYRIFVQRVPWTMMPIVEDIKHLWHDLLFYFGRRKHKAYYGRYNYAEKVEYLAVVWGTFVMIITGFMMWNPIATTNYLPGQFIPAAKAAHGGEAVLAVLAIILWHFYHVHLRHFNKSIFIGKMTRHEMEEEHPAELALIETGQARQEPSPAVLRRRQNIFYPIASVIVIVAGVLLLDFITFEKTAIATVPPAIVGPAFVPYTPTPTLAPSPTPVPTMTPTPNPNQPTPAAPASGSWDTTISSILNAKCAACHVSATMADLSLKTYADALKGGKDGPAIVPGDPAKSLLVQIQQKGGHAGQLTPEEIDLVIAWIKAGAPETSSAATPAPTATPPAGAATSEGWTGGIDQLVNAKCAACHVNATMADLSLKTYADALKGGKDGPAIVPGDPAKSLLVQIQQKGGHAGQLTPEEIDRVIAWIKAGAPETSSAATPPPTATPPAGAATGEGWTGGIDQLVNAKCAACHVNATMADLSLKTYASALKGGKNGPAIVPGDPAKSLLVQIQQKGGHAGQLTPEEIDRVIAWIKAGAPETSSAATPAPTATPPAGAATGEGWTGGIDQLVTAKCAACHVNATMADLSLKTYAGALKGGKNGPAIVPGDPAKSLLVQIQQKGGHAGQFTPEEIDRVIAWIKAGAPETSSAATPPPATPPAGAATGEGWTGGIDQLVTAKCAACHVNATMADLSLKTYADALKGGKGGPAIVPGDPAKSLLVQIQQKGGHAGQFTPEEIERVIAWIKAGAPETSSAATPQPGTATTSTAQWSDFATTFTAQCGACHVNASMGGLSLKTYADALKGGKSGPAIVPGNLDKSVLVQIQQKGGHAANLSPEALKALEAWISAGAPETAGVTGSTPTPAATATPPPAATATPEE